MKRALSALALALGALLLGAFRRSMCDIQPPATGRHGGTASGSIAGALPVATSAAAAIDGHAEIRRRVRKGQRGTYITDILLERDSSLARWPERRDNPLTVWIQPESPVTDFTPSYVARVREAFVEWDALRLPVRFAFVDDSAEAEVHVSWIDHFDEAISGRTRWARDDDWTITDANISLAVHHHEGEQLDEDAMRALALHEIGHLLGLDHTNDSLSIMAPRVRVRDLSAADRATVRLLYTLPPGPLR